MMLNVYSFSIAFSILFLLVTLELVRKSKLLEKYSLLWIFFGFVMLILSSTPYFIERIARLLEIKYAPSVLFLLGFVYLIIFSLNMTTVFSKQSQKITTLTQEIAILKEKLEHEEKENQR
ncbi:MAG: DUF2304 domain-containing protein [Clostridia bacterium]|nr:DUF2304 domain-containing protein [Clostridia bacterium]